MIWQAKIIQIDKIEEIIGKDYNEEKLLKNSSPLLATQPNTDSAQPGWLDIAINIEKNCVHKNTVDTSVSD